MEKQKAYQPISCNYYDHLEAMATLRKRVVIRYFNEAEVITSIEAIIKDFYVKEKVEFMVLDNGLTIRLDRLVDVDGETLSLYC
jgi:Rho-binding antiterminator